MCVIAIQLIDIVLFVGLQYFGVRGVRWSRALRCWYVVYSNKSIRLAFRDIRKTVRDSTLLRTARG